MGFGLSLLMHVFKLFILAVSRFTVNICNRCLFSVFLQSNEYPHTTVDRSIARNFGQYELDRLEDGEKVQIMILIITALARLGHHNSRDHERLECHP